MRVSIIIAAFNVGQHIQRAIESVQAQTVDDWELLVVDDASQDGTAKVVQAFADNDSRIRLIRQRENGGPSAARNRGLTVASGAWVAILDADDAWRPERLERMLAAAARLKCDFVADNQIRFDEALQREVGLAFDVRSDIERLDATSLFSRDNPAVLGTMKPLIRRTVLDGTGLRYDENVRFGEDFLLYSELLLRGVHAVLMRDAYYIYTTPVGTLSRQRSSGSRSESSLESLLWIVDALAERYGRQSTPAIRDGMARCRKRILRRMIADEITRLRRTRRFGRLAVFLVVRPHRAITYLRSSRTWQRAFRRSVAA